MRTRLGVAAGLAIGLAGVPGTRAQDPDSPAAEAAWRLLQEAKRLEGAGRLALAHEVCAAVVGLAANAADDDAPLRRWVELAARDRARLVETAAARAASLDRLAAGAAGTRGPVARLAGVARDRDREAGTVAARIAGLRGIAARLLADDSPLAADAVEARAAAYEVDALADAESLDGRLLALYERAFALAAGGTPDETLEAAEGVLAVAPGHDAALQLRTIAQRIERRVADARAARPRTVREQEFEHLLAAARLDGAADRVAALEAELADVRAAAAERAAEAAAGAAVRRAVETDEMRAMLARFVEDRIAALERERTPASAASVEGRIARYRALLEDQGDAARGRAIENELRVAEAEHAALLGERARLDARLRAIEDRIRGLHAQRAALTGPSPAARRPAGEPPPAIHGRIVALLPDASLVMLDVGENDGALIDDEFVVYRDAEFVGRVRVVRVFPDMSAAEPLAAHAKSDPRVGDEASTRVE